LIARHGSPSRPAWRSIIATPVTGAYGYSMASNYNRVPRPAVLFVSRRRRSRSAGAERPSTTWRDSRCEVDDAEMVRLAFKVSKPVVRVGIIGAGNVGGALVELLNDPDRREALLDAATGPIELVGVAVRDAAKRRKGFPSTAHD